jgi:hypothetical protein
MTSEPEKPRDEASSRRHARRFAWASGVVVALLLILLALGLSYSITSRNKICPPGNPDCGRLPPTAPPALLPGQSPPPQSPQR